MSDPIPAEGVPTPDGTTRIRHFHDSLGNRWRVHPDGHTEIRWPNDSNWQDSSLDLAWLLKHTDITEDVPRPVSPITEDSEKNAITERWVSSTPDEISHHSGDGHRYARWGQCVISYDEEREPIPAVYSSGWVGGEVEFGADHTWRLSLDEAEAFISRLQHAIAYERARGGESDD